MSTKKRGATMNDHCDTSIISLDCKSKDTTLSLTKEITFNNLCENVLPLSISDNTPLHADKNTPTPQTEYTITNIRHEILTSQIDCNTPLFTAIENMYSKTNKKRFSFNDVRDFVNNYTGYNSKGVKLNKHTAPGLLKGLYNETGYNGIDCIQTVGILPFDIDVKNTTDKKGKPIKENVHLFNKADNSKVFDALKVVSPFIWRSNSKYGIAGFLIVPQLKQYNNLTRTQHKKVGTHITNYLSNYLYKETGVRVKFDNEQSKLRQVRYIAPQDTPRELNLTPFVFKYDSELKIKVTKQNVPLYKTLKNKAVFKDKSDVIYSLPHKKSDTILTGTIFEQFNADTDIYVLMQKYGFTEYSKHTDRIYVKHENSKRTNTGYIDVQENFYLNFSNTFGGIKEYLPSDLLTFFEFDNDYTATKKYLYSLGYADKPITNEYLSKVIERLATDLSTAKKRDVSKVIFSHCSEVTNATTAQKKQIIAECCINPQHRKYFIEYLKLADYTIKYDAKFVIKNWVSEKLKEILKYADTHKHIICKAETGTGKTFAFVDEFIKLHPTKRILILAPLTMIVDQNRKKYDTKANRKSGNYVFLTGNDNQTENDKVSKAKIVFATYEQGANWITHSQHNFDYIIVDEIHNLITANSYKAGIIEKLTPLLENNTVIGLTGSPSQAFNLLGYKILNVANDMQPLTDVEIRYSNTKAYNVALNHLTARPPGKVLMRVNSIDTIRELTDQLVKLKLYNRSEVLHLYSTNEIKNSVDYNKIALKEHFADQYRLILTTSVIDEGVSIKQTGFTDIVFIETDYNPRPEAIKQFFARFRNVESARKNIAYLRQKLDQTPTMFKPESMYRDDLNILIEDMSTQADASDVLTTYNTIFSNNKYLYGNGKVNPYYLAYATTNVLFQRMNTAQYLEYLESNYNLSFTKNNEYQVTKYKANDTTTKERKQLIAKYWIEQKKQVYQALRTHTLDKKIRLSINEQQINPPIDVLKIVMSNIKDFEKLFKRTMTLTKLGANNIDEILINLESEPITLNSSTPYADEILFLTIEHSLNLADNQATPGDKKTKIQFIKFAEWCAKTTTFTNFQMIRKLKELRVLQSKSINEKTLFRVLELFNLEVIRNYKSNTITCKLK